MRERSIVGWLARVLGLVVLVGGQLVFGLPGASGATFNVTNGNDSGAGSLRQAFLDATNTAGDDTVAVDPGVNTITLTSGEVPHNPADNAALTLQGNGVTIQQTTPGARVIFHASTGLLTVNSATITGGNAGSGNGGGIRASGAVSVSVSTIRDNTVSNGTGGGLSALGAVTLDGSAVRDNVATDAGGFGSSGGVFSASTVTIMTSIVQGNTATTTNNGNAVGGVGTFADVTATNSAVIGNTASTNDGDAAGGLGANGGITLDRSTVIGNMATTNSGDTAGGLGISGDGIAVDRSTVNGNSANTANGTSAGGIGTFADVTVTNSTVTGNTATASGDEGGGIGANDLTLTHSTIVGNTGASAGNVLILDKADNGSLTTFGSAIADPLGGGTNCVLATDGTTSTGYNFADDTACGLAAATDNQNAANDPMLGALGINGGATPTMLPQSGSPLIDAIPTGDCDPAVTTDQRGVTRPQAAGCDIGSVEVSPTPPPSTSPPGSPPVCPTRQASLGGGSLMGSEGLVVAVPVGAYAFWRRRRQCPIAPATRRGRSRVSWLALLALGVVVLSACVKLPPPIPGC